MGGMRVIKAVVVEGAVERGVGGDGGERAGRGVAGFVVRFVGEGGATSSSAAVWLLGASSRFVFVFGWGARRCHDLLEGDG